MALAILVVGILTGGSTFALADGFEGAMILFGAFVFALLFALFGELLDGADRIEYEQLETVNCALAGRELRVLYGSELVPAELSNEGPRARTRYVESDFWISFPFGPIVNNDSTVVELSGFDACTELLE